MVFTASDLNRCFNLLEPYTHSGRWWVEGHLNYQSLYLLFKNLPFLQRFSFEEAIHLHGLSTENRKLYLPAMEFHGKAVEIVREITMQKLI